MSLTEFTGNRPANRLAAFRNWRHADLPIETFVVVLTVLLWIILAFSSPYFLTHQNIINLLRQVSIAGIIAFGQLLVIIIAGIDLSVGSMVALTGVLVAQLMVGGVPILPAVLLTLGIGACFGALNAFANVRLGIPAFIVTLAGLQAYRGLALLVSNGRSISGMPTAFTDFADGSLFGVPNLFICLVVLGFALHLLLRYTRTGSYLYAMGSNLEAAKRVGIRTTRLTFLAYMISAGMASIAGILLASRLSIGTPTAGVAYELDAIAAVVVGGASLFGGRGTILGTFCGALLFATIANGATLLGVNPFWTMVATGVLIAVFVYLDNATKRKQAGQ